ncbi:probable receptor-like protein kinase At5g24010 isoform X2 [Quercus robur]|uniref:probable receptor-like protein kinase At5g24010 isoform X2 n=2 Tax=Quercus robur TaxID=38942 RepID=UPI002162C657|nr:probable receptor-like protein kinase At5g24010 isoform X2 [Quercus robur]
MEKFHIFPLFLLYFLSLLLFSSAYTPRNKYFINCGSKTNVTVNGRNFVGDSNSSSLSFFVGPSSTVSDTNSSTNNSLYQTARIFTNSSLYEFDIIDKGNYYLRIHFFPFVSGRTNLADALFDVSASDFYLLSNFALQNNSNSPVIKEFLLTINGSKFSIHFTPHKNSFAFVSAIEVFLAPPNFTMDGFPHVTPIGENGTYYGVPSQVLHTIHRVNVGGPKTNDTLWRNWIPDDEYLLSAGSAKTCATHNGTLNYDVIGGTNYSAPDLVYKTCKELNLTVNKGSNSSNITWQFGVSKSSRHMVRLHFCDIISKDPYLLKFNLYIYSYFSQMIYPYEKTDQVAAPFYWDFVVDSDNSGYMNISVGAREDSITKTAYLNGVEIMEFIKQSDFVHIPVNRKKLIFVVVGTVCGVTFIFILVVLFLLKRMRAKHVDGVGSKPEVHLGKGSTNASLVRNLNLKLKMPLLEVQGATHNFDSKRLVGEGGFGKVYEGSLQNGMKVAVKRSDSKHGQGLPEFKTEILVLSRIRHRHLVSLIGYCDEGSEMILVYEFMEKGSLREHLYDSNENSSQRSAKRPTLTWKQRLEICIGAAKGLHYLHTCLHGGIIHRDVKSTNILLNEHYVAKVADFGLSRSGPDDPEHFSVGIKGSFGYVDPEYFRSFQFTDKSDVYSFGVVLLEVLCARPAILDSPKREEVNLAEWGMLWQKKGGQLEKIMDPLLVGDINPDSLRKFGETAVGCLKENGAERPTMLDVLWDLEYALQLQKTAVQGVPNGDSTTNAILELHLTQNLGLLPEIILDEGGVECNEEPLRVDNGSDISGVFSQIEIDGAR